jgi:hypothetical protein
MCLCVYLYAYVLVCTYVYVYLFYTYEEIKQSYKTSATGEFRSKMFSILFLQLSTV